MTHDVLGNKLSAQCTHQYKMFVKTDAVFLKDAYRKF